MQNQAAETKLRAERKGGELLKQMEKSKGSKGNQYTKKLDRGHDVSSPTLQELGIHHKQSQRWQQIADLPEVIFEEVIEETKEEKKEL